MAIGREDYNIRKENRIEKHLENAKKASDEATRRCENSHARVAGIPFGQPILVGHHSERRHRNTLEKSHNDMKKSIEAREKEAHYLNRAESAKENNAISADNPEAIALCKSKLASLEAKQERMKSINKAFKKGDEAMVELGLSEHQINQYKAQIERGFPWDRQPYPSYTLTNNNAEIRRMKARIKGLEQLNTVEAENIKFTGGELVINVELNRVQLVFDSIPSEEVRKILKSNGFRWARTLGAWQRQRTVHGIRIAKNVVAEIEKLENI